MTKTNKQKRLNFLSELESVLRKYDGAIEAKYIPDEKAKDGYLLHLHLKCAGCDSIYSSTAGNTGFTADDLKDVVEVLSKRLNDD